MSNDKKNKKNSLNDELDLAKYTLHNVSVKNDEDENDLELDWADIDDEIIDNNQQVYQKKRNNHKTRLFLEKDNEINNHGQVGLYKETINQPKALSGKEFLEFVNSKLIQKKVEKSNYDEIDNEFLENRLVKNNNKILREKLKPQNDFNKIFKPKGLDDYIDEQQAEAQKVEFKNDFNNSTKKPKSIKQNSVSFRNSFNLNDLDQKQIVNIKSIIDSTLFLAGEEGVSLQDLKRTTGLGESSQIKLILNELQKDYDADDSGLILVQFGDKFKLLTQSKNKDALSKFVTTSFKTPLSQRNLETLAIIAYNQPTTRAKIQAIRDRDPKPSIDALLKLNLIVEAGRQDTPGHPILYTVSQKFYDLFGIRNLTELPRLNKEIKEFNPIDETTN
ncbi:SMC-Scp complex subunit ScpB, long form [Ureaplasma urealyticum]|uniref:Segregation/condensation protein B n=3 Tax=Ureaplasma urealyticum TaxID=2130 RepID=A0AAP9AC99_UREUR|nr:SMC-Scp complex subunit ScpB, long form [Ureaplasma urealyticum]EDX53570.1 segregation and condensation protein B [Ureaplasma urealyticum serovar 9 str. ATCC 33175]EDT49464.1 segregation and condensation protein B [Ureaplasma urealyticum serovar 13 str. ATCC 33698]EDU06319.1 segregation and condensation protein B [Ureaplasma urealyticum serovar 5 str. ATCC 27817]EDU66921.1 segregation and condensation protein B [Ureaplasma urealyticum serovar 11 str. ATCC 33695]EDX53067.1 segregation and co